ncbi:MULTISPECIES: TonB C-terminal domain-containing protein [unclassified Mesorhizobium]|uniref:TonB C-terminal domain-containing protein n=1 Tax=unclassified Mesorhizobium TaxID=325217 RepID=UPI001CCDC178|nr:MULTISPECIES: TonB C-terminal domain-containing protein [unclassified Mesorhizobium]MBZ9684712.1 TonB C-terminal domain-containing protein [Mesorhizobium sp. CO1-1-2]MBZ9925073.1 TonB C-terminal domain-containing protein [Mesorhizobium sp. BR1-1-4]
MKPRFAIFAAVLAVVPFANAAIAQERPCHSPDPIDTIKEMSDAIYACWKPPPGTAGMSLTIQFSLRRNGTLIGTPRATYSDLGVDPRLSRAFVASILKALDDALPLPFPNGMGGAIAGRMLSPRFTAALERAS